MATYSDMASDDLRKIQADLRARYAKEGPRVELVEKLEAIAAEFRRRGERV